MYIKFTLPGLSIKISEYFQLYYFHTSKFLKLERTNIIKLIIDSKQNTGQKIPVKLFKNSNLIQLLIITN